MPARAGRTGISGQKRPLTIEVALAVASIHFAHGDPADHFLAASAKIFDLTLLTADENLVRLPEIRVLSNH